MAPEKKSNINPFFYFSCFGTEKIYSIETEIIGNAVRSISPPSFRFGAGGWIRNMENFTKNFNFLSIFVYFMLYLNKRGNNICKIGRVVK